jgi:hypothetical protein
MSTSESSSRQKEKEILDIYEVEQLINETKRITATSSTLLDLCLTIGVPGGGAEGAAASPPPHPSFLGKQSQSGNIRFTVGQYWLIIKIYGTNSVNFVGISVNFVGNII